MSALLTESQARAATYERDGGHVYIEAGPGSGKTMVSAARFGYLRFTKRSDRGVLAVSFTRSATAELARRVRRLWGPTALAWPNRIQTLDTLILELVQDLLHEGLLIWPGGARTLTVYDSWAALEQQSWTTIGYRMDISDVQLSVSTTADREARSRVPGSLVARHIRQGVCTHDDVRAAFELVLALPSCRARIVERLRESVAALIVDEVFDANELDLGLLKLALDAGIPTTVVGDPWQALYVFRGATPAAVPKLLSDYDVERIELLESFRWANPQQSTLASSLRAGSGVAITPASESDILDVVLSSRWQSLWELADEVLPLAFKGFRGGYEEAAATVLLNSLAMRTVNEPAPYLRDALRALAIREESELRRIDRQLEAVLNRLRNPSRASLLDAYAMLSKSISSVSPRTLRPAHYRHTDRLRLIGKRIRATSQLVPGLTILQAKGREWDRVGVALDDRERERLGLGLKVDGETDRRLYVALTRARIATLALPASSSAPSR